MHHLRNARQSAPSSLNMRTPKPQRKRAANSEPKATAQKIKLTSNPMFFHLGGATPCLGHRKVIYRGTPTLLSQTAYFESMQRLSTQHVSSSRSSKCFKSTELMIHPTHSRIRATQLEPPFNAIKLPLPCLPNAHLALQRSCRSP